jgi:aspartyl protease family protein
MDADSIARLVYLLLLLAWVGVFAALGRRRRWGKALRDLGVWGLIIAMAVVAYGFRDVLRRELMPASYVEVAGGAIELRRQADGHFRAELEVNGVPVRFVVDTGASLIVLSREDAARVGIDPATLAFDGRARTANGAVSIASVRLDEVAFGPVDERRVRAAVNGGDLDESLLGMNYLNRFERIEISGDRMRLVR